MSNSDFVNRALIAGTDDWVHASDLVGIVGESNIEDLEALRLMWIGLVSELLAKGLMVPGDADRDGFHPWGYDFGRSMERIVGELDAIGLAELRPGSVCWLNNTPVGEELGQAALSSGKYAW